MRLRAAFLVPALAVSVACAQETGLYDAVPPANSAFVRVLNASSALLAGKTVGAEKAASAYIIVPQGELEAKVGAVRSRLKVEAGNFYSVVSSGSKLVLLKDQAAENRAKALVTVYNLSKNSTIDLKTADGKTTVVAGVKAGESGSRAVNGLTVDLSAFAGTKAVGTVKGVRLERGNAYALVVTDSGMTVTQSTTKTK